MRWVAITLQVVLGVMFLFSAVSKLTGGLEEMREHLLLAPWFWALTALVEIIGGVGMLAGLKYARLAALAGLWLAATMVGAIFTHLRVGDPATDATAAAVLLVLALTVAALRRRPGQVNGPVAARSRERTPLQPRDVS
jgi:putative oxidoreductase